MAWFPSCRCGGRGSIIRPRCRSRSENRHSGMGTRSLTFSLLFEIKPLCMCRLKISADMLLSSTCLRQPLTRLRVSARHHRSRTLMVMKQARTRGSMARRVLVKPPPSMSLTRSKKTTKRTLGMPKLQQALQPRMS